MILRHTVQIYTHADTYSDIGVPVRAWTLAYTLPADVQPATMAPAILKLFGLTDIDSNSKIVFIQRNSNIAVGQRMIFESNNYEIRATNSWNIHTVFLAKSEVD